MEMLPKRIAKTRGNSPGPGAEKVPTPKSKDIRHTRIEMAAHTHSMIRSILFIQALCAVVNYGYEVRQSENGENILPETPIFLQHTDRAFSVSESLALLPEI
jgi:hypothetical protein